MMAYFGEVVKMCANISYLMMTLNRYLLVGKDHAPWLVSIAKFEFKWVIRGSLLLSVLINIGHGWEYQAAENGLTPDISYQRFELSNEYSAANGYSYSDYPVANQGTSYFIYSIVYLVVNFGIFLILNTCLEIKIVRRMHKELKEKRKRILIMKFANPAAKTNSNEQENEHQADIENKKREEEDGIKERKVIQMVVLNGFVNLILRAPEIFFWLERKGSFDIFLTIDFWEYINKTHLVPGLLNLITDIGYLSYCLTFSSNFFIFYKFNKNFNEAVVFWNSKTK
jgi:hypothetical protein